MSRSDARPRFRPRLRFELPLAPGPDETLDAIGEGEVRLLQRKAGYRFNLDAVLLADFAMRPRGGSRRLSVIDLGTGCGVIALLLKSRRPVWSVAALELQPSLADLARRNAELNGLDLRVVEGDLRAPPPDLGRDFDLVVANPPFFAAGGGHRSPDDEKAIARQEWSATADDLARATKRLLKSNGAFCVVYPAGRLPHLFSALAKHGLTPTGLRAVHPRFDAPAGVVLVEARPESKRPLAVGPPLVVHDADGPFGSEVATMLSRRAG